MPVLSSQLVVCNPVVHAIYYYILSVIDNSTMANNVRKCSPLTLSIRTSDCLGKVSRVQR